MIPDLTNRERQLLLLKANGCTDAQAAQKAGISVRTVTKSLERTYRKLRVHNCARAVAVAVAIGEIGVHEIVIPETGQEDAA